MPFWSMVAFMVKWAIASIPAFIILALLTGTVIALTTGFVASLVASRLLDGDEPTASAPPASDSSVASPASPAPPPAQDLACVEIRHVEVGESTLGDPGVFGEIKNVGDRTLTEVELTVYCLGADGQPVFEQTYHPVVASDMSFGDAGEPLKPNYSRKFGYNLEDAPSDWARKVRVEVTKVVAQ
jgi:hypothetical protein